MTHMAFNVRIKGEKVRNTLVDTRAFEDESCHGGPDIKEFMADLLAERFLDHDEPTTDVEFDVRKVKPVRLLGVVAMTVVSQERCYGGPEEGGWYYNDVTPVRVFYVSRARAARMKLLLENWCRNRNPEPGSSRGYEQSYFKVRSGVVEKTARPHYC